MTATLNHDATAIDATDTTMTSAEIAAELGITPRLLRKHLRKVGVGCGQGSFYVIDRSDLPALRTRLGINV